MSYLSYNGDASKGGGGGSSRFLIIMSLILAFFIILPYLQDGKKDELQEATEKLADDNLAQEAQAISATKLAPQQAIVKRTIETDDFIVGFTNAGGGRAESILIKNPDRYLKHGDVVRSQKTDDPSDIEMLPFAMHMPALGLDAKTAFAVQSPESNREELHLTYDDPEGRFKVEKRFLSTDLPYVIQAQLTISNYQALALKDDLELELFIKAIEGEEPGLFRPGAPVAAKCLNKGSLEYINVKEKDVSETYSDNVSWAGVDESYFAIVAQTDNATTCTIATENERLRSQLILPYTVPANGSTTLTINYYTGPKEAKYLTEFGHELPSVIDYGWIELLAKPMAWILDLFFQWTANWGLAIILLTLIVRSLLWPIATKSQVSMMGMSKVAPLMKELQEKYKDDPATLQQKQLELYKEHKVNPFGCLPLLLQMPIFFALYRCIFVTGGLYNAPFVLWITDLSAPDPYYILPVLAAGLIVVHQMVSPKTVQSKQQKMMLYSMPIIFGVMMLFLPSGLCLYMVVSSAFSMVQSMYIRHRYADAGIAKPAADGVIDVEVVEEAPSKDRRAAQRRKKKS